MDGVTTREAAKAVGISRATLQVWIASKVIRAPRTQIVEGKAVRLWREVDLERLRRHKEKNFRKGRGRKPKQKK